MDIAPDDTWTVSWSCGVSEYGVDDYHLAKALRNHTHPKPNPSTVCCCRYGAAVSGEWPEFECGGCPRHGGGLFDTDGFCKRHMKGLDNA